MRYAVDEGLQRGRRLRPVVPDPGRQRIKRDQQQTGRDNDQRCACAVSRFGFSQVQVDFRKASPPRETHLVGDPALEAGAQP